MSIVLPVVLNYLSLKLAYIELMVESSQVQKSYSAGIDFVKTGEQIDDGCFSGASRTNQ